MARDPVDAEPDSDFTFAHLLSDLQVGDPPPCLILYTNPHLLSDLQVGGDH